MKKLFSLILSLVSLAALAQPEDEDIVYYEDSQVRRSRFSISILGNPTYTDRRLINDEIPLGGGFDLVDDQARGSFNFNYAGHLFYSLSQAFDVGVGAGYEYASYKVEDVTFYLDANNIVVEDTVLTDATTDVNMWVVPVMLNFNTSISEVFDLEVIPTVKLTFIDSYITTFEPANGAEFTRDFTDDTRDLSFQVGISLGGTYYFSDNFGLFVRANGRYMLNSMVEIDDFPRETIYSIGANIGLKFRF